MARACRLRGPPRPRSLEHARDDRRRRHAHLHRALLVRVAARRRPSAREPGARAGRVLVHGRRSARVLHRLGRERHRDRPPRLRWLGLRGSQAAHGQGLPGAGRDRRRNHGNRLLVLRRQRVPHDLPGPARSRAEAERLPLEVLRDGRGRAHGRDRAGRVPGAACARRLALPRRARRRVDRSDQPRAHQPRHGADDADRGGVVRARAEARRSDAREEDGESVLLLSARRLARLLRRGALPRLSRRAPGRPARLDARASGGGNAPASVPDHGRRHRDVRGVLVPARDAPAHVP